MELSRSFSRLGKYQQTLHTSWIPGLAVFCSICTLGFLFLYFQKPIYQASAQLELPENKPSYSSSEIASKTSKIAEDSDNQNISLDIESEVIRSTSLIRQTLFDLNTENTDPELFLQSRIDFVQSKLQVSKTPESRLLKITYQDTEATKTSNFINTLVDNYLEYNIDAHRKATIQVKKIVEAELLKIERKLQYTANLIRKLKPKNPKLQELENQRQIAQSNYKILHQHLISLELAESQNLSSIQVLSYAITPDRPISNYFLAYFGFVALGLLGAVTTVYLLEVFDRPLKILTEAQKIFDYTWLGVIPTVPASPTSRSDTDPLVPQIIVKDDPASDLSESYRMLQSNLNLFSSDREIKAIAITSSVTKEGKSSITANLAYRMAQLGKKVLIIDGNLHSPIQHRIWNTHNDRGLSNNIVEKIDPRLTIQTIMSNLDLVSAGTMPPASANVLRSQIMKKLVNFWAKLYDCILIDSPALDINTKASILGSIADGILLVVRPSIVEQKQANLTRESLQKSGQNILGMVFNNISQDLEYYNYYYHSLEEQPQTAPKTNSLKESSVELWETITRDSAKLRKNRPNSEFNIKKLRDIDRDELEAIIIDLQQNLDQSTQLVKEQEDELSMKCQDIRKLQRKVNIANNSERLSLESELKQEQEIKNMLNETLIGQRQNLNKKSKILLQYRQLLQEKSYH